MSKNNTNLVQEVRQDFERRKKERQSLELSWLLNINFLIGNQNTSVLANGEIIDENKSFHWQENEVYNHIAPIIESRLSKFGSLKSSVTVRPATSDLVDINGAKFSTKLLKGVQEDIGLRKLIDEATFWSEVTGTAFYKVIWNKNLGRKVSTNDSLFEGDIDISVCPPYEIFPDSLTVHSIDNCKSIIHARAYPVKSIEHIWGVKVKPKEIDVINMGGVVSSNYKINANSNKIFSDKRQGQEVVIERYNAPDSEFPKGRLTIIVGDILLFDGDLPYCNRMDSQRGFPFIKQECIPQPTSFFGGSVVTRLIPIQKSYNNVKNRKHEYLNRIAMGVMMVEDGSVDIDDIQEDGLAPGKVIIYRQGSNLPVMMNMGSVPNDYRDEEDRLLSEFISISGVSDFLAIGNLHSDKLSGVALSLIMEQDNNRLSMTSENIRLAIKEIGKHILRIYKQFANTSRLKRVTGDNGEVERISFQSGDITSDDVIFEVENEIVNSLASRKALASEILSMGLLHNKEGKISDTSRLKLLEIMGFGNWESSLNLEELHQKKAQKENIDIGKILPKVIDVDNHEIHIAEHTRYLISTDREKLTENTTKVLINHVREHKRYEKIEKEAESL